MRQTFRAIPRDYEEAAMLDGATRLQVITRILLPMARPGRVVRLGLPMAAALAFGAVLLRLWPEAHREAAAISGSAGWLGGLYQAPYTFREVIHQATTSGMLSGYGGSLVLPQIADALLDRDPITRSLDPPLWTLHYEFWGSVLVTLLSVAHRRLPLRLHLGFAAALVLIFARYPLLPFVVGHLFALTWRDGGWPALPTARWRMAGIVALAGGIWSCTNPAWPWVTWLSQASDGLPAINDAHLQAMYGALLTFAGVMLLPSLHRLLTSRMTAWLGRISFGLYLTHFPILFTVASATFVALREPLHYGGAALAAFVVGMPLSLLTAEIFTRLVDRPAVRLTRMLSKRFKAPRLIEIGP